MDRRRRWRTFTALPKLVSAAIICLVITSRYEGDLLFLLHDTARLIRVEADKRAKVFGMTRAQWALLLRLEHNPGLSQKEVACLLDVEPISVARLVDRLETKGLIERRADSQDRRKWRLHLCAKAQNILEDISIEREALAKMVMEQIPQMTQDQMVAGLTRMKTNLLNAAATRAVAEFEAVA